MTRLTAYPLALLTALGLLTAGAAQALTLPQCARYVHWHAVEAGHRDMGEARVAWAEVWSAEGIADDFHLVDCATGEGLKARARAERMGEPVPYDRRTKVRAVLQEAADYPLFFSWEALEARLVGLRVPVERLHHASEPCACAAQYPEHRGTKTAFEFETAAWALEIGPDGKARKRAHTE